MVTLVGLAWAMSYHRTKVKLRPIIWGLSLQFVLALIILRSDIWSFIGMVLLGLLVTAYLLRDRIKGESSQFSPIAVAYLAAALVAGYVLSFVPSTALAALIGITVLVLIINGRFKFASALQAPLGVLFIAGGIAYLYANNLHGQTIFQGLSEKVAYFLSLSDYGARFLFGNLANQEHYFPGEDGGWPGFGFQFAFVVLPTIVFFGGFMGVLYYYGIMQKVVQAFSHFMRWTIGTSGAETLSCSANVFVGQTEAPLLIRPFLDGMTKSELLTIMVGGFATIAGGVLAGYIAMGVPAGHLIAATVMSAPAALVIGKIIYPELEDSQTAGDVELPEIEVGGNAIEAASNGITDGLKLAVNVGAMLLGFIALIAVIDVGLNFLDRMIDGKLLGGEVYKYDTSGMSPIAQEYIGIIPGSLQTLFGTLLRPLAFMIGVPWEDAAKVGNLLGIKLSLNEFVSFGTLGSYIQSEQLSERAIIISTYALCGFANFSSIGIQIGGISALAPHRKGDLAKVGLKAMFGGALASWLTATIAGMLL
ncbi:MAG: NupC/NupG family nucleoside CNT transporter [Gammaproteobacteria bacterium]|nr:NupC/NupG family nucleoside CNT transporter [Gammaproteobacteria bacterium]